MQLSRTHLETVALNDIISQEDKSLINTNIANRRGNEKYHLRALNYKSKERRPKFIGTSQRVLILEEEEEEKECNLNI